MAELDVTWLLRCHELFSPWADGALRGITWLGNGLVLAALVVGAWPLIDREGFRRHFWVLFLSTVLSGALVTGLKYAVHRPRPAESPRVASVIDAETLARTPESPSFPSGHAQTAFAVATYLMLIAPRVGAPAMLLALLVALSRVALCVHYPSDVIAGALLGAAISAAAARWRQRRAARGQDLKRAGAPP